MKKILLSLITVAALSYAAKAQNFGFEQSDLFAEGAIGVSSNDNKQTETRTTSFNLSPKVGYFLTKKFAVGIQPTYQQTKNTDYSGSNDVFTKTHSFGAGIFGRYYFLEAGSRFKVYSELGLGYTSQGGETSNGTVTVKHTKLNTIGINGSVGANFFLTQNIAVGYQFANIIGFQSAKANSDGAKATNTFNLNLNNFNNFFSTGQFSLTFRL